MKPVSVSVLGRDPNTKHRLNAASFQQDALLSHAGWQYCTYYLAKGNLDDSVRHVAVARRKLPTGQWQVAQLSDYEQTTDDGHNTISMGICPRDGTIHLAFDNHCNQLKYCVSVRGLCHDPAEFDWSSDVFGSVDSRLPGMASARFQEVTYPRFVLCHNTLLFECRTGMAGEGSDMLCRYNPDLRSFQCLGTYLAGVCNSPYVHGLSYEAERKRLHVSWMYREYVPTDKSKLTHIQHSGPNGPENNRDLAYAYSDDLGLTWHTTDDTIIAEKSIQPSSLGIIVRQIACGNGLLNQEGQCVDQAGNFHILSREIVRSRKLEWRHIMRDARTGQWTVESLPEVEPTATGSRGKVCSDPATGNIYFIVPGNVYDTLHILVKQRTGLSPSTWGRVELLCSLKGYSGEVLVDEQRLAGGDGVLSIFTLSSLPTRNLLVLDFDIAALSMSTALSLI